MRFYWLILGILSVWRITHLLQAEDGPGDLLVRFRRQAGAGFWGTLLDCFYCLSVWIAVPLAVLIGESWRERLILWPAFSAGAILLERLTKPEHVMPPELFFEEEDKDVLLRKTENDVTKAGSD